MRRIDVRSTGGQDSKPDRRAAEVVLRGEGADGELVVSSADDVTFPAVWQDGDRVYDVEIWRDGELVATVPPRSPEVDAAFDEHERRRASG